MGVCESEGVEAGAVMWWCTAVYSRTGPGSHRPVYFSLSAITAIQGSLCVALRPQTSMIMILTYREIPDISISEFCLSPVRRGGECPGDPAQCVA